MEDSLLRPYASSLRSRACQDHCNLRPPSRRDRTELVRQEIRWLQPRTTSGATKKWRAKVVHGFQKKESLVSQDARMKRIAWLGVSINFSRRRGKFQRRIFSKKSFAVNWKAFFVRIGWRFTQNLWPFGIFRAPESPGRKKKCGC